MTSGPITSWQIDGSSDRLYFGGAPKSLQMVTAAMKLKDACSLEEKLYQSAAGKSLQSCPTLRPHTRQPTRLPHPLDSPGKNTGVGCHFLLQCVKVK